MKGESVRVCTPERDKQRVCEGDKDGDVAREERRGGRGGEGKRERERERAPDCKRRYNRVRKRCRNSLIVFHK